MINTISLKKLYLYVGLFAIAMGLLEAAVVVYLRELSFPNGFGFPLKTIGHNLAKVELWREVATIVMLITVGYVAGHNKNTRFGWFLYSFALWDIFYYVFLKLFIQWPESIATWDVLFLLPVMWIGPVWAPVLLSLIMIGFTVIINQINKDQNRKIGKTNWTLLIVGSITCITSFCIDFIQFSYKTKPDMHWMDLMNIQKSFSQIYIPQHFPYILFLLGTSLVVAAIVRYYFSYKFSTNHLKKSQLF